LVEGNAAEIAFVVGEDRRRLGLATALFRALVTLMRRRGVARLVAQVQVDNGAMLGLFRQSGAALSSVAGTEFVEVNLPLAKEGAGATGR
jgi:ribosomal protein S18 acetylase RimI-like enzyme